MDRVAKPTNYEPPRVRTYPQGTQGWVAVHYSATTMCPFSMGGGGVSSMQQQRRT